MELKNTTEIYIYLAVVLLLIFLSFLKLHGKEKFIKGKKTIIPEYLRKDRYYKNRMIVYKILKIMTGLTCIIAILASSILIARPYTREMVVEEKYCRDIFICMDISTSVDELNQNMVSKLKNVVENLSGDRVGIVIFNTTPVVLCPLTDDYDYVLDVLDKVEDALDMRNNSDMSSLYDMDEDELLEWIMLDDYISCGTLVGNEERGSSIIGDGLAATAYDFPDLKEDAERTRIIIFTSDNDMAGTPIVTLDEAATICKENNIIVYGIGTEIMLNNCREEMKAAVEKTGGKFYMEEDSGTMKQIVNDIDKQGRNLIKAEKHCVETEHPKLPFLGIMFSVVLMFLFLKLSKR